MAAAAKLLSNAPAHVTSPQKTRSLLSLSRLFHGRLQPILDLAVLVSAMMGAYLLRFDFEPPAAIIAQALVQTPYVVLVQFVALTLCGVYTFSWQYFGRVELRAFVMAAATAAVPVVGLRLTLPPGLEIWRVPYSVIVLDTVLMLLGLFALRFMQRELYESYKDWGEGRKLRRVLVIGGAGYIGSALLPNLLKHGYQVRVLDLLVYGTEAIEDVLDHPRLEVVRADFRQVDKVVDAMRDVDAVIHLGAIVGDPACALDEELTTEINLMATRMIAEVAKGCGISRFVFASTCSVYGASDQLLAENSPINPISLYARSKIASERVLLSMADMLFAPTILRFATIYGLSGRTRFDLVVNLLTAKALVEGQITIRGGDQWRPFVHVEDAAIAVLRALQAPLSLVRGQTFNVGSDDQNYTILEIGQMISALVPSARVIATGLDPDRRNYRVTFAKIRRVLNFVPEWSVEAGIRQVLNALERGRVRDYRDARYSNVKFLTDEARPLLMRQQGWAHDLINEAFRASAETDEPAAGPAVPPRRLVHLVSGGAPPA